MFEGYIGDITSTRTIFDKAVMKANRGWTILFAASRGQTALDTNFGGAYSLSLLSVAKNWEHLDEHNNIVPVNVAHNLASQFLSRHFYSEQIPTINQESRSIHFPLFVKQTYSNQRLY